jgi:hypothetical protein
MESLEYYVSIPVNPFADDDRDQEDVILAGEFQFQMDSIVETIGTNQCKHNIDLFLEDLYEEMELATLANFYNRCLVKLIEVYDLYLLEQYATNRFYEMHMKNELRRLLHFFEHEGWIDLFAECLPSDKPEVYLKGEPYEYIELHYKVILDNFKIKKEHISKYVYYQLVMASKSDTTTLITNLIKRNRNGLVSQMILNRGV